MCPKHHDSPDGQPPGAAMASFKRWVETAAAGYKPVFVGFNACFDWQFVNWYFESFAEGNPFGFAGIDSSIRQAPAFLKGKAAEGFPASITLATIPKWGS